MSSDIQKNHSQDKNLDSSVIEDFGYEWQALNQSELCDDEQQEQFDAYFSVFEWEKLPLNATGFDAGCGSGRWADLVAPKVGHLHCVDPSIAIEVAKKNLSKHQNCSFHRATVGNMPFDDNSMDFGYSLGVLHHIPDTQKGIVECVRKLKSGAPFLIYLYYAFDNQPPWFKCLWKISDLLRSAICRLPHTPKFWLCQFIALFVYWPLARTAIFLEKCKFSVKSWPLSDYRYKSFYTMRTDALDRFGTKLETRFTRDEIQSMMESANLSNIKFSNHTPFHCAVGYKN